MRKLKYLKPYWSFETNSGHKPKFDRGDVVTDGKIKKLILSITSTKDGQVVHFLPEIFFKNKNKNINTSNMSNRKYFELLEQENIRANNTFDAWLFTINRKYAKYKK